MNLTVLIPATYCTGEIRNLLVPYDMSVVLPEQFTYHTYVTIYYKMPGKYDFEVQGKCVEKLYLKFRSAQNSVSRKSASEWYDYNNYIPFKQVKDMNYVNNIKTQN